MSLRCPCCRMLFQKYGDMVDHYFGTDDWKGCRYYSDLDRCPQCAMTDPELAQPGPFGKSFNVTGTSLCWACFNQLDDYQQWWCIDGWKSARLFYGTPQAYFDFEDYSWAYKKWWLSKGNTLDTFDYCGAKDFRNMNILDKLGYMFTRKEKAKLEADKKADRQAIIDDCKAIIDEMNAKEEKEDFKKKEEKMLEEKKKPPK